MFEVGDKVTLTTDTAYLASIYIDRDEAGAEGTVTAVAGPFVWVRTAKQLWPISALMVSAVKTPKPRVTKVAKAKVRPARVPKPKQAKIGFSGGKVKLAHAITLYPQTRKVLVHMESHGTISPLEAFGVYRITRLAARIKEIRDAGVGVITNIKTDATGTRYAEYALKAA